MLCECVYQNVQECLEANSKTVYDLLSSHGAVDDVVFFAMLMKGTCNVRGFPHRLHAFNSTDFERVITHYIRQSKYMEALLVLRQKGSEALESPEKVMPL